MLPSYPMAASGEREMHHRRTAPPGTTYGLSYILVSSFDLRAFLVTAPVEVRTHREPGLPSHSSCSIGK
jgi:hypothetical protein